jgi:uncharacterized membrane protein
MQNPPGPPGPPGPSGPPPPMTQGPGSGMDKKTAATLAYLLTWVTGIIFLFVGKDDPDVKFHAARAIVTFLPLQILISLAGLLPSPVSYIGFVIWIGYIVAYVFCLYKSWTGGGQRFEIPFLSGVVDTFAEQLAARVELSGLKGRPFGGLPFSFQGGRPPFSAVLGKACPRPTPVSPGGGLLQLLEGGPDAPQQLVPLIAGFGELLAKPADFRLQPLQAWVGLADLRPQVIGLDPQALGLDAPLAQLCLELLDDVGGGVIGHAPEV